MPIQKKVVFLQSQKRSLGRVARRWSAKPFTPVRVWKRPLKKGYRMAAFFLFKSVRNLGKICTFVFIV